MFHLRATTAMILLIIVSPCMHSDACMPLMPLGRVKPHLNAVSTQVRDEQSLCFFFCLPDLRERLRGVTFDGEAGPSLIVRDKPPVFVGKRGRL